VIGSVPQSASIPGRRKDGRAGEHGASEWPALRGCAPAVRAPVFFFLPRGIEGVTLAGTEPSAPSERVSAMVAVQKISSS